MINISNSMPCYFTLLRKHFTELKSARGKKSGGTPFKTNYYRKNDRKSPYIIRVLLYFIFFLYSYSRLMVHIITDTIHVCGLLL